MSTAVSRARAETAAALRCTPPRRRGLVNIFRPEIVIIGGGIAGQGDYFIKPLNAAVKSRCYANKLISPPETVAAALGNDAGIIGAAMLCMQKEDIK